MSIQSKNSDALKKLRIDLLEFDKLSKLNSNDADSNSKILFFVKKHKFGHQDKPQVVNNSPVPFHY